MLQIFSDASSWKGISFATTIILKNWHTQISFFSKEYRGMDNCTVGEIMGVQQGLIWVMENAPKEKNVEIYTDNLSVVRKLQDYTENRTLRQGANQTVWTQMYGLCDYFESVSPFHVYSHQFEPNPNKTCDSLCAALLRSYKAAQRG